MMVSFFIDNFYNILYFVVFREYSCR
ncbi:Hypothetical protein FNO222_1571 [Francisella orientalis]|uniref:Uncharacterized protein n=1 Tax=Francisella orientalis TaxID=299583 RepID=A0ABM5U7Z7_9GAMM|nr:hypothetical protein FNO12_1557 [Francisella orientalis FNO12]AKN87637.1 Hypothetical protein FNO24_1559 [Francisella orientalis FNO24]AKN89175.1 Hypothetical protein FNO190_1557 [Francisella orientalis]AKU05934.1 Hypothetical protein FNO01_1557 [Francisella orientalis]QEN20851.1 Hypothetical protein FNO39_1571 [Francisella orientalis]